MNRRSLLASLCALPLAGRGFAATPEWQARIISGGFDSGEYLVGIHIMLAPGWKTYWRVPGDAGIPPQIAVAGRNISSFKVEYPLPEQFTDESGVSIGYHDEVVFPLVIKPKEAGTASTAQVSAFFGVCKDICKPAKFEAELGLNPKDTPDRSLLDAWQSKVPRPGEFVSSVRQAQNILNVSTSQPSERLFAEGAEQLYFKPQNLSGQDAIFKIVGLKQDESLRGTKLKLTALVGGRGLEQDVTVA